MNASLAAPLAHFARIAPDSIALSVGDAQLTYGAFAEKCRTIAGRLLSLAETRRVGVLATRSVTACVGVMGAAWAGSAYIPLNVKLPEEQLAGILRSLDLDALVVDARGARLLTRAVVEAAACSILISDDAAMGSVNGATRLCDLPDDGPEKPVEVSAGDLAYIIFTSGTTGQPKGVMIPIRAVQNYLAQSQACFRFGSDDRVAETCDISFDPSVHNMLLTWQAGASLHVMTPLNMAAPAQFIRERQITAWASVPSIVGLMQKANALTRGCLPSLRLSLFGGEPLPLTAVRAWAEAAPNSEIHNEYGPTEATISCLRQRVAAPEIVTPLRNVIAIGKPHKGMKAMIVNETGKEVPPGTPGDIAVGGVQVGLGYFGMEELTARRFPMIDGEPWYLTGDLGMQDTDGIFHHLGRIDNQVKVLGHRIELEEIEAHLRDAAGSDHVAAVAWPVSEGSAKGLVAFVAGTVRAPEDIRNILRSKVATYMVPRIVYALDDLPLSGNGKVDRNRLRSMLDSGVLQEQAETVA